MNPDLPLEVDPGHWQSHGLVAALPGWDNIGFAWANGVRIDPTITGNPAVDAPTDRDTLGIDWDGTDDEVSVGDTGFLSAMTLCMRMRFDAYTAFGFYHQCITRGGLVVNNTNYFFGYRTVSPLRLYLYAYNGAALRGVESATGVPTTSTGHWHDIVATWISGSLRFYVDGQFVFSDTDAMGSNGSQPTVFGNGTGGSGQPATFPSYDLRVYDHVWSPEQVAEYTDDPFAMWQTAKRRPYLVPAAPPAGAAILPSILGPRGFDRTAIIRRAS